MNSPSLLVVVALIVIAGGLQSLTAQNPAPAPVPTSSPRRAIVTPPIPGGMPQQIQADTDLSRNYRLVISFKSGEKIAKEIVLLTASTQVRISAAMEADEVTQATISAEMSGMLAEKEDGRIRFSYQLGASVPTVVVTSSSRPAADGSKPEIRNVQYVNESASGVLVMEPGKTYEIFKSSERSYTVTIQPEEAAKVK